MATTWNEPVEDWHARERVGAVKPITPTLEAIAQAREERRSRTDLALAEFRLFAAETGVKFHPRAETTPRAILEAVNGWRLRLGFPATTAAAVGPALRACGCRPVWRGVHGEKFRVWRGLCLPAAS